MQDDSNDKEGDVNIQKQQQTFMQEEGEKQLGVQADNNDRAMEAKIQEQKQNKNGQRGKE